MRNISTFMLKTYQDNNPDQFDATQQKAHTISSVSVFAKTYNINLPRP